ncbi:MAG: thymidylate synthase [Anaerocolumna sp.]
MKYINFQEAYLHNLNDVYYSPEFINMPRGYKSKEKLNLSFTITDPIDRICCLKSRKTNIIFNFAEALWYLSGSNELSFIEYYAKNMRKYSADGVTLKGTAYGPKIFSYGKNHINQWDRLIEVFKEDVDSKRALITIFDPNENLLLKNIDVSCTIGLQFFIRNDALFLTTFMRANDAYRGMISDVFSFTFIQEMLATQLGLKMGEYCHNVATVHVYETDNAKVEDLLSQPIEKSDKWIFPSMPCGNNWDSVKTVLLFEKQLRENKISLNLEKIHDIEIEPYWKQVIILFALYQHIMYKSQIDYTLFNELIPLYQYLVKCKWSELFEEVK